MDAPWTRLNANGDVSLDANGRSSLSATISQLNAGTVAAVLAPNAAVATLVDASVSAQWPGTNVRLATGQLTAQLTPDRPTRSRDIPIGGSLRIDANDQIVTARIQRLGSSGVVAQGVVTLAQRETLGGGPHHSFERSPGCRSHRRTCDGEAARNAAPHRSPVTWEAVATIAGSIREPHVATRVTAPALQLGTCLVFGWTLPRPTRAIPSRCLPSTPTGPTRRRMPKGAWR